MSWVMEAMHPDLYRSIALHVVNLQAPWHQFPRHFAADVLLHAIGQCRSAERDPALIVIKLHVFSEERSKLLQVAPIVGIEQYRIERRNRLIQLCLRLNIVESLYPLRAGLSPRPRGTHRK